MSRMQARTVKDGGSFTAYIDVDITLKDGSLLRTNVYLPKTPTPTDRFPVLATYGIYGKDWPYETFHPNYKDLPEGEKSEWACWEVPHPPTWCPWGYAIVRCDERGSGQSPGVLEPETKQSVEDFAEVIEWAAEQSWSNGKVGLAGISYYALIQWMVASLQPKGLACIIPWEGASETFRDQWRHGGILQNRFMKPWFDTQVARVQYGRPGRQKEISSPDTFDGDLDEETLAKNMVYLPKAALDKKFADDEWYTHFDFQKIKVPLLSAANLGGINLHLRGNCIAYMLAQSTHKWLYFHTGRHDLPFYLPEGIQLQKSFFDAFLKGEDPEGWLLGPNVKKPAVRLISRQGNPGINDLRFESTFNRRWENEWPLARTQYTRFYCHADGALSTKQPQGEERILEYPTRKTRPMVFTTSPFADEFELAGHVAAKLTLSLPDNTTASDIDVFVTLRHFDASGEEVQYTGSFGQGVPVTRGWLRASQQKLDTSHPLHAPYLPVHTHTSVDAKPLRPGQKYVLDVEVWPTTVLYAKGSRLQLEIAGNDDPDCVGRYGHDDPTDRSEEIFGSVNRMHVGGDNENYILLPVIPSAQ